MSMTTVDIAVLFEKAIILNGMIANGSSIEEKKFARAEMNKLMPKLLELANYSPTDKITRSFI